MRSGLCAGRFARIAGAALIAAAFGAVPAGASITAQITEFSSNITTPAGLTSITPGPDGNLWFTERAGRIGRITTSGAVTEFSANITAASGPEGIAAGPDGNLWFTESVKNKVGRITPDGVVTEFATTGGSRGIVAGPDGNMWFTEYSTDKIGRITPGAPNTVTEFTIGITPGSLPAQIISGPDGNLWFTEYGGDRIARITTGGSVDETTTGIPASTGPWGITMGSDGNPWFAAQGGGIGPVTPAGAATVFAAPTAYGIAKGSDGNMWFTDFGGRRIGVSTPSGVITYFTSGISPGSGQLEGITSGPDGNLWFVENGGNRIARLVPGNTDAPPTTSPGTTPPSTSPPVVPQSPASNPPIAVTPASVFVLPSAKTCVSRRAFRIRLRTPAGLTPKSATVLVNGKRVLVVTGKRLTAPVDLKGLPRGRFTVSITLKFTDGRSVREMRRYRTCAKKPTHRA